MPSDSPYAPVVTWKELARHGEGCEACAPALVELRLVPDDPFTPRDQLCDAGRNLYDRWAEAKLELLEGLNAHRARIGMVGLSAEDSEMRARALERLIEGQFAALLAVEPAEAREGQIRALVTAQRRTHRLREVRLVAISSLDDRLLLRWSCDCGEEARGDYFTAQEARQGWERHAGRTTPEPPPRRGRPPGAPRFAVLGSGDD